MEHQQQLEHLTQFFKALSDPNRLKIVGLLSNRPHTVEQLGDDLGIRVSTVSHHLAKLSDTGLVSVKAEGYYRVYSLNAERLTTLAKTLLKEVDRTEGSVKEGGTGFEAKVRKTFLTEDGRIKAFPVQEKKYLVLLRHVLGSFEPGVRYPEKRVNQILQNFNEDTAQLRRALVDFKFMAREGGGGKYWRIDGTGHQASKS